MDYEKMISVSFTTDEIRDLSLALSTMLSEMLRLGSYTGGADQKRFYALASQYNNLWQRCSDVWKASEIVDADESDLPA